MSDKETILKLWAEVRRPGVDSLCTWLESTDFFTAPASRKYHSACVGGLARHSLNVYDLLFDKATALISRYITSGDKIPHESIVITGLGHDLCKVNYYKEGGEPCSDGQFRFLSSLVYTTWPDEMPVEFRKKFIKNCKLIRNIPREQAGILIDWLKSGDIFKMPDIPMIWSVDDQLPLGHGEKSLYLLQQHIKLTDEEAASIRWHMGMSEAGTHFSYPSGFAYNAAKEKYPLLTLLECADQEASHILEREYRKPEPEETSKPEPERIEEPF